MIDPAELERRACDLYRCPDCSADLDHPGADCDRCLDDQADGQIFELPSAWDELEPPSSTWTRLGRWAGHAVHVLAGLLVAVALTAGAAFLLWGFLTPEAVVIPLVNGWKAAAWAWALEDGLAWLLVALLTVVAAAAVRVAVLVKP